MPKFARVDVVKNSFFYCVIPKWNSLPEYVVEQINSDTFLTYAKGISRRIDFCGFLGEYICINNFVGKCH